MDNYDGDPTLFEKLMTPFRKIREAFALLTGEDGQLQSEQGPVGMLFSYLTLPFRLFIAFIVFMVQAWTTSRNGFAFLRGAPAAMVIAGFLLAAVFIGTLRDRIVGQNVARYVLAQEEHPNEPTYAEGYIRKAVELAPHDVSYKYQLALALEKSGKKLEARNVMHLIAIGWKLEEENAANNNEPDPNAVVDPEREAAPAFQASLNDDVAQLTYDLAVNQIVSNAHVWLANDLRTSPDFENLSESERFEKALVEYERALNVNDVNRRAMKGISEYWEYQSKIATDEETKKKHLQTAESYIDRLINDTGGLQEMLQIVVIPQQIKMLQECDDDQAAVAKLNKALENIQPVARANPEIIQIWITLVECAALLEDYEHAQDILNEGLQYARDPFVRDQMNILKARVFVLKADHYKDLTNREDYINRLYALCEAVKASPSSLEPYDGLVDYMLPEQNTADAALWMRDAVIGCPFPAVVHILLGFQDIVDGDFPMAQERWKMAEYHFALAQYLVNNLIEAFARADSSKVSQIMDILTVAMQLFSEQPVYYQTRGRLLSRNGDHEAAIADFNTALERDGNLITARIGLVDAYRALDEHDKAREQIAIIRAIPGSLNQFQQTQLNLFLANQDKLDRLLLNQDDDPEQ